MKRFLHFLLFIVSFTLSRAQVTWDGGGDGVSWTDANNWTGNNIPSTTDAVVLDNSLVLANYTVNLPATATTISINTLTITPAAGLIIQLTIPVTNTANPGLSITGAGDALILNESAILMNSTGAASAGVGLSIVNTFRINNGGKYVHNNVRGNAGIVTQLSTAVGTETGIFEFDVPGIAGFAVSLSGRNYGTLVFSAVAAAAARTYTGNGASDLTIRGDLIIKANATLSSTMTADIKIAGNLVITGNFVNNPSAGVINRSIFFNGTASQNISGGGNFTLGTNFRKIEVNPGSIVTLQRGINISNAANGFLVNNGGILQMGTNIISGNGTFQLNAAGWLGIGSADGITTAPTASGNVRTATRSFSTGASYEYNGTGPQFTGDGLPATIEGTLKINNILAGPGTNGVTLSRNTFVDGAFVLAEGKLTTASPNSLITLGAASTTTTAYLDNSFVNGPMIKYGNTFYRFPVGKGTAIHPAEVIINSGGTPDDFYTAEYFNSRPSSCIGGSLGPGIDHVSSLEYWIIKSDAVNQPTNFQVTLYATTYSYATDRDRLVITQCLSGTGSWANRGNSNTANTGAVGPVTSSVSIQGPYTSLFANFTLASVDPSPTNPLPITLISFDAMKLTNTKASIKWELAAFCSATAEFEIEKASDNRSFFNIATVNGNRTNRFYTYTDDLLKGGINYYRLKMTDEDGKKTYSRTVAIINGVDGLLLTSLVPTIITNNATLTIASSARHQLDLMIVDMQGRIVQKQNHTVAAGNTSLQLSTAPLPAGVYQLVGNTAEGKTNLIRFIKK